MKALLGLALTLTLTAGGTLSPAGSVQIPQASARAFPTPEAAIQAFVESLRRNDLPGAISTFAIDEPAAREDYGALAKNLKVVHVSTMSLPGDYREVNRMYYLTMAVHTYRFAVLGLMGVDPAMLKPIEGQDPDAETRAFIESTRAARLKDIRIVEMRDLTFGKREGDLPSYVETLKADVAARGADESVFYQVILELGKQRIRWEFLKLYRYGASWKLAGSISAME